MYQEGLTTMSEKQLRDWLNAMATKLVISLKKQEIDITHKQALAALSDLTVGEVEELITEQKKAA